MKLKSLLASICATWAAADIKSIAFTQMATAMATMSNKKESKRIEKSSTSRAKMAFHMPKSSRLAKSQPRSGSSVIRKSEPTMSAKGWANGGRRNQTSPAAALVLKRIQKTRLKTIRSKARRHVKDTKVLAAAPSEPFPHFSSNLCNPRLLQLVSL